MSNKIKDFEQLHSDWRNISINQLSFTNNLILTFSAGFFIYIISQKNLPDFHISLNEVFNFSKLTYALSLTFLIFSLMYGTATLFTRLYDFRITRNIIFARSRNNNNFKYSDYEDFSLFERLNGFYIILFKKLPFLSREDAKKGKDNIGCVQFISATNLLFRVSIGLR